MGTSTRTSCSAQRYAKKWRRLAAPIERRLGWRLFGFDPDLVFYVSDNYTATVPVELARVFEQMDYILKTARD